MSKVAITGHTRGVGYAIANELSRDFEVKGFSLSNGFDIRRRTDQVEICEALVNVDIFINNAFDFESQEELFEMVYECWEKLSSKTIVNIGSRGKYVLGSTNEYYNSKISLEHAANSKMFLPERKCRIVNINAGYVLTESNKERLKAENLNYITSESLAEYVRWAIEQPIEIWELSLWQKGLKKS